MIYTWVVHSFYKFFLYTVVGMKKDFGCCQAANIAIFQQYPDLFSLIQWLLFFFSCHGPRADQQVTQVGLKGIVQLHDTNYWSAQNTAKISSGYFSNYFHS